MPESRTDHAMELLEGLLLVLTFILLLGIGVPVAWTLGIVSLLTLSLSLDPLTAMRTLGQRFMVSLDSFPLLAIPFFILAGQLMNQGGIARRLIDFAKSMVGALPGGLAHITVVGAMLFGAISGSSVAAASAIGSIIGPRMEEEGYSREFGAAINVTSSSMGLVIPPSNVMIIYSLASGGTSIAALFVAGYIPGILTGLFLMAIAGIIAVRKRFPVGDRVRGSVVVRAFFGRVPSLFLLVVVIGGIVAGIFTATEAAAIAVLYCLALGFYYRELAFRDLPELLLAAAATTADRHAARRHVDQHVLGALVREYPASDQRRAARPQRQQDRHPAADQPDPAHGGDVHGHHAGRADLHAHLPAGRHRAGGASRALRHHHGAEPVHRDLHAAGGYPAVRGGEHREHHHRARGAAAAAAVRRNDPGPAAGDVLAHAEHLAAARVRVDVNRNASGGEAAATSSCTTLRAASPPPGAASHRSRNQVRTLSREKIMIDTLTPIARQSLADNLAARIRQLIQSEGFEPGDRLPTIAEMSRRFGVGHPTLREALKKLETLGMVSIRHGSGVYVGRNNNSLLISNPVFSSTPSQKLLLDLVEARVPIEITSARLAALNATPDNLREMRSLSESPLAEEERPEDAAGDGLLLSSVGSEGRNRGCQLKVQMKPRGVRYSTRAPGCTKVGRIWPATKRRGVRGSGRPRPRCRAARPGSCR
jgi:DNA-binding transcriptional regulator YhcF (GntR family)